MIVSAQIFSESQLNSTLDAHFKEKYRGKKNYNVFYTLRNNWILIQNFSFLNGNILIQLTLDPNSKLSRGTAQKKIDDFSLCLKTRTQIQNLSFSQKKRIWIMRIQILKLN